MRFRQVTLIVCSKHNEALRVSIFPPQPPSIWKINLPINHIIICYFIFGKEEQEVAQQAILEVHVSTITKDFLVIEARTERVLFLSSLILFFPFGADEQEDI